MKTTTTRNVRSVRDILECTIDFVVAVNGKRGAAAKRFARYHVGMSVAAALDAGLRAADIRWDIAHGLIAVTA